MAAERSESSEARLTNGDDLSVTDAIDAAWAEVEHAGRSVDRQIECLRSILAAADPALAAGPLGDLVRDTPDYVAARGVPARVVSRIPVADDAATGSVLAGLHAISNLAARGLEPTAMAVLSESDPRGHHDTSAWLADVVWGLVDDVTERFRNVLTDVAARDRWSPAAVRSPRSTTAPLAVQIDQLTVALAKPEVDAAAAASAVRLASSWLLIAVHVAEIRGWVQAVRALQPPLARPA